VSNTSHITIEDQRGQRLSPIKNKANLNEKVNDTANFNNVKEEYNDDSYVAYQDIVKGMDNQGPAIKTQQYHPS